MPRKESERDRVLAEFDAMMAKQRQRKMVRLTIGEVSGVDMPATLVPGWVVMKSTEPGGETMDAMEQLNSEALTLVKDGIVASLAAGIAYLADHKPELAVKAQKAAQVQAIAKAEAAAKAAENEPKTANEKLAAAGKELWQAGRANTPEQGYVMAMEFNPDLVEEALNDANTNELGY